MVDNWLSLVSKYRLIAVIRANRLSEGIKMAHAAAQGGIKLIEITWNSDQPLALINRLRAELSDCYIGVGTILSTKQLHEAIDAGIQFAFSPHFAPELIDLAHNHNIPFIPGALSPTEIINAFNYGAKTVKVFPVQVLGGVNYLKNILAPLPELKLIPTGGIKLDNAADFINNGAVAVGLSTDLFPPHLVIEQDWETIQLRAQRIQLQLSSTRK
jgi:2-dehydro-3-deoxyphosphogluconate aldolase/(4S)-4-hydroxy-2-oxoglutarate aldolase